VIEGDSNSKQEELFKEKNSNDINGVISRAQEITESLEKTKQD